MASEWDKPGRGSGTARRRSTARRSGTTGPGRLPGGPHRRRSGPVPGRLIRARRGLWHRHRRAANGATGCAGGRGRAQCPNGRDRRTAWDPDGGGPVRDLGPGRAHLRPGDLRAGVALAGPGGERGQGRLGAAPRWPALPVLGCGTLPRRSRRCAASRLPAGIAARLARDGDRLRRGPGGRPRGRLQRGGRGAPGCGGLTQPQTASFPWSRAYTRDQWLDELLTHSDHLALVPRYGRTCSPRSAPPSTGIGGSFHMPYLAVLVSATRA